MNDTCPKCGGTMQPGASAARDISIAAADPARPSLIFVLPGPPASSHPIRSFPQGRIDEPGDRIFVVQGMRCAKCGFLELYAVDEYGG